MISVTTVEKTQIEIYDTRVVYEKDVRSIDELLEHLSTKGLVIDDEILATSTLSTIGYYRLIPYMRNFQDDCNKQFKPHVTISHVLELYEFDRRLRLFFADTLERLEVTLRAALNNYVGCRYGPHWFMDQDLFENTVTCQEFDAKFLGVIDEAIRNGSPSVVHYRRKYKSPKYPPTWTLLEHLSFGTLSRLLSSLKRPVRQLASEPFDFDEQLVVSWFRSLTIVRNIVAHHGRLWGQPLTFSPKPWKRHRDEFGQPPHNRLYQRYLVSWLLLQTSHSDRAGWLRELRGLLDSCAHTTADHMGFPRDWQALSTWQIR